MYLFGSVGTCSCFPTCYRLYLYFSHASFLLSVRLSFSFEKHPNFKEFAIKRFKGLMVPYLWINLITYLFWLFAGRNFGEDATISTTWYSPIIGILLGYSKQMIHNTPMWFSFVSISWKYFTTSYSNRYKRKANR